MFGGELGRVLYHSAARRSICFVEHGVQGKRSVLRYSNVRKYQYLSLGIRFLDE